MFARHIFRSAFFHTASYCVVLATTLTMRHVHIHTTSAIRDGRLWIIQKNNEKKKHRKILVIIDINLELYSLCSTPSKQRAAATAAAATASSSSFRIMASQKCFRNAWICQCGKLTHIHHPWICLNILNGDNAHWNIFYGNTKPKRQQIVWSCVHTYMKSESKTCKTSALYLTGRHFAHNFFCSSQR